MALDTPGTPDSTDIRMESRTDTRGNNQPVVVRPLRVQAQSSSDAAAVGACGDESTG